MPTEIAVVSSRNGRDFQTAQRLGVTRSARVVPGLHSHRAARGHQVATTRLMSLSARTTPCSARSTVAFIPTPTKGRTYVSVLPMTEAAAE